jgi:hypothetical protein
MPKSIPNLQMSVEILTRWRMAASFSVVAQNDGVFQFSVSAFAQA